MSHTLQIAEREAKVAEANLTDDEARQVKDLVEGGAASVDEAIAAALAMRETPAEHDPRTIADFPDGEPTDEMIGELREALTDHEHAVQRIMGPFVEGFEPCDKCDGIGLVAPTPPTLPNEQFRRCPTCNGHGQVESGSIRPGYELAECGDCGGRGFQVKTDAPDQLGATAAAVSLQAQPNPQPFDAQPTAPAGDAAGGGAGWGVPTWMGDPKIGQ